jgi:hypothetical protein
MQHIGDYVLHGKLGFSAKVPLHVDKVIEDTHEC